MKKSLKIGGSELTRSTFRERTTLVDIATLSSDLSKIEIDYLRLKIIREEIPEIIELIKARRDIIDHVANMLNDPNVGVPQCAAEALKAAVRDKIDISFAVPTLISLLDEPRMKYQAAGALAVYYMSKGELSKLEGLITNPDASIRDGALYACSPETTRNLP